MADELKIKDRTICLMKGDIADLDIDAFVYYAQPSLVLGSGFGGAIATRGGPKVQEELKKLGTISTGEAVVTSAGNMKARFIIHAVGPRFQEEETEKKLEATVKDALRRAEEKGIQRLAFPAMGAGFYGIPLDLCSRVMIGEVKNYLENSNSLKEVVICLRDSREYDAFLSQMKKMA